MKECLFVWRVGKWNKVGLVENLRVFNRLNILRLGRIEIFVFFLICVYIV